MKLSFDEKRKGMKYGFSWNGITVYPLTVKDYELNITALSCLTIMQQAMPVQFLGLPYLRMLHESAMLMPEAYGSNIIKLKTVFMRSFHVAEEQLYYTADSSGKIKWYVSFKKAKYFDKEKQQYKESTTQYAPIDLTVIKNADEKMLADFNISVINEADFMDLRELICEINAQEIPDETVNLDIWQSERDINAQNATPVEFDFEKLLFSMAVALNISIDTLCDMTIWEFINKIQAVDRNKRFMIYALAEQIGGAKYKEGNPCPDWKYDKKASTLMGMMSYGELANKFGQVMDMPDL